MKKIVVVAVVIGALVALYFLGGKSEVKNEPIDTNVSTPTQPDPSNATFIFEEDSVTLSRGKAEIQIEDSSITEEVELTGAKGYGDMNKDGKTDTVTMIARLGGGSGVFIYAAAYVSGTSGYKGTNAVYLGDRIEPQSISVTGGVAKVTYLDRKDDEPLAAEPTVQVTKEFVLVSGELRER